MFIKIGGDTLALDAAIRRQIEREAQKLADRFPGEQMDANFTIQEEFDQVHGHRVRCELSTRVGSGRQVLVRDARKAAGEAISEVFTAARRNVRRLRRHGVPNPTPVPQPQTITRAARIASR